MTANHVANAALRGVPQNGGPANCHQAAVAWLMKGMNKFHAWELAQIIGLMAPAANPNRIAEWLPSHIYLPHQQLTQPMVAHAAPIPGAVALARGDILFTWDGTPGHAAMHSMVVTRVTGNHTYIRGFNNQATFLPTMVGANPAPMIAPDVYDPNDRDVADARLWNAAGLFAGLNLYRVTYSNAAARMRAVVFAAWRHFLFGNRWRHVTPATGCPAGCPHTCPLCAGPAVCAHVPT